MANELPAKTVLEIMRRVTIGQSLRKIAREVGVGKGSVQRYKKVTLKFSDTPIKCLCGKPAFHREWCEPRIKDSPGRQRYLNQCESGEWHGRSKKK